MRCHSLQVEVSPVTCSYTHTFLATLELHAGPSHPQKNTVLSKYRIRQLHWKLRGRLLARPDMHGVNILQPAPPPLLVAHRCWQHTQAAYR